MKETALSHKIIRYGIALMLVAVSYHTYGMAVEQQRQLFADAERAIKNRQYGRFLTTLEQLEDYPLYPYLKYKYFLGKKNKLSSIKLFLEEYANTPYANSLRNNQLSLLASQHKWNTFVALYQDTSNIRLQCLFQWALHKTGDTDLALAGAERLWLTGHSQPSECDDLFTLLKQRKLLTDDLIWQRFGLAMRAGNLSFARYLKKSLAGSFSKKAALWLKVYRSPEKQLSGWRSWPANKPFYSEIFEHGLERLARKNLDLALNIWDKGRRHFNVNSLKSAQLERIFALNMARRHHPEALEALFALTSKQDNEETRTWRVRTALLFQNWHRVNAAIKRLSEDEQKTPRWQYWKARALSELGEHQKSTELYKQIAKERDFYGFLAADQVEQNYSFNNKPIQVSTRSIQRLLQSWPFKAMQELIAVNHELDARRVWWYTSQRLEQVELLAAARLAKQWGWNDVAIITAARAKHWGDMELRFPLAYKDQVLKYAAATKLDPSLVYGVIRRESAFRADVSSRVGARGLMQIMPRTGRMLARKLKDRWRSASQLYKPEINLRYGTAYLKQLSERYANNLAMVAAAYNAGPHRVDRWRPESQSMPADIWVEAIPFTETREYVKAVLSYMSIYDHRLGGNGLRISTVIRDIQPSSIASGSVIKIAKN